jgi:hypothetical protein
MSNVGVPPPDILQRAQAETARIYAAIGVTLVWTETLPSLPLLTVKIVSEPILGTQKGVANAMGFAPGADEGTGRTAYAFYGRIEASAQRHRTDVAKVLGYVIAHELGHILLARGTHSSAGIMNGRWNQFQMDLVADSLMRFTNEQATLIRATAAEMNADHKNCCISREPAQESNSTEGRTP